MKTQLNLSLEEGNFTVFAPTDAAFAKLSPDTLDDLFNNDDTTSLTSRTIYHLITLGTLVYKLSIQMGLLAMVAFTWNCRLFLIPKLTMVVLGVHYEPLNSN